MPKSGPPKKRPIRVGLISLGCAKNLVDAEIMLGSLMQQGIEIVNDAAAADAVIVNTCSFIDAAQEESIDAILESAQLREVKNRGQALIVSGCLPQRFREELPKLLPEVDAFLGVDQVAQIPEIVERAIGRREAKSIEATPVPNPKRSPAKPIHGARRGEVIGRISELNALTGDEPSSTTTALLDVTPRPVYIPDYETPRFRLTPGHFAYVKIAEGCNHPCSFCTIPRMRGAHRSRGQDDIIREARGLIAEGVKELNLISQDSTYYGLDLQPRRNGSIAAPEKFRAAAQSLPLSATTLCTLLRELNGLEGDFWIRLLYTHPAHWTDELIRTIADCPKVARYIDIPLQHIHDAMLERMRRETSRKYIEELLARIRAGIPGISIRTTFIVGFPGETDEYFESLLEFIRATRFERLGVFMYSQESGTRSARMAAQIPQRLKEKRSDLAMAEQLKISRQLAKESVGRTIKVLIEKEATARELERAEVRSWEHGFIRSAHAKKSPISGRFWVGRGEADAPDIDGRVYVRGIAQPGDFFRATVVGHTDYDLLAQPAA